MLFTCNNIASEDGALYLSSSDSEDDIARAVIDTGAQGGDGEGNAKVSARAAPSIQCRAICGATSA